VCNRTSSQCHCEPLFFCADDLSTTSYSFVANTPTTAVYPPSLANARRRMFAQQESNSFWVLLFVNRRASTCRSSGSFACLHVCSTSRAGLAYSSSSIACKCDSENVRSIRGVSLPHGAYFEGKRDRTRCYCNTFVPWDVSSAIHPHFRFGAASVVCKREETFSLMQRVIALHFSYERERVSSRFHGSYWYTLWHVCSTRRADSVRSPSYLAYKGEMESFRPMSVTPAGKSHVCSVLSPFRLRRFRT